MSALNDFVHWLISGWYTGFWQIVTAILLIRVLT